MDAICDKPVTYDLPHDIESEPPHSPKYQKEPYTPEPHYLREN